MAIHTKDANGRWSHVGVSVLDVYVPRRTYNHDGVVTGITYHYEEEATAMRSRKLQELNDEWDILAEQISKEDDDDKRRSIAARMNRIQDAMDDV